MRWRRLRSQIINLPPFKTKQLLYSKHFPLTSPIWTVNKNVKTRAFFLFATAHMKSNHGCCGRLLEWEEMAKRGGVCKEQYVGKCIYSACPTPSRLLSTWHIVSVTNKARWDPVGGGANQWVKHLGCSVICLVRFPKNILSTNLDLAKTWDNHPEVPRTNTTMA